MCENLHAMFHNVKQVGEPDYTYVYESIYIYLYFTFSYFIRQIYTYYFSNT